MERPGGSVRHVPNPLPKGLLSRRGLSGPASVAAGGGAVAAAGGTGLVDAAEREAFERGQKGGRRFGFIPCPSHEASEQLIISFPSSPHNTYPVRKKKLTSESQERCQCTGRRVFLETRQNPNEPEKAYSTHDTQQSGKLDFYWQLMLHRSSEGGIQSEMHNSFKEQWVLKQF